MPSVYSKPTHKKKLSHKENCAKVCLVCFQKKPNLDNITASVRYLFTTHIQNDFDFDDPRFPTSICMVCRMKLREKEKNPSTQLPPIYDYSSLRLKPSTRYDTAEHVCTVCELARKDAAGAGKKKKGKIAKKHMKNMPKDVLCGLCFARYGKGHPHKCKKSETVMNATENIPLSSREQIASATIKEKEERANKQGPIMLKTRGRPLPVSVRPTSSTGRQISANDLSELVENDSLTLNQADHIQSFVRKKLGQKSVQNHAMKLVVENTHCLDKYFESKSLKFKSTDGKVFFDRSVPVACDVTSLLEYLHDSRSQTVHDTRIKVGIDSGGTFLKICLSILPDSNGNDIWDLGDINYNSIKYLQILALGILHLHACYEVSIKQT